jgi:two-component system response regulator FlrC
MNVLVVDDEITQIEVLGRGLRSKGHKVLEALDADEALKRLTPSCMNKIELVLSDYLMPRRNGIELLKMIRKNHRFLPVILMTAFGEKDLIIEALRNRCDGFIEKPFTLDQLIEEMERVMT